MEGKTKHQLGKEHTTHIPEMLRGNEYFCLHGTNLGLTVMDYWQFQYSNLIDNLGSVAEFLVAKALLKDNPDNANGWSLYDVGYRDKRIEVKATSYFQSWKASHEICEYRVFSIRKTHVEYQNAKSDMARQNDIYIFCVDIGRTKEAANPLCLENWQFYVIPTIVIDEQCGNQKTISLNRVQKLFGNKQGIPYCQIKDVVDNIIDRLII